MKKRALSFLLALVMCMHLVVPTLAASPGSHLKLDINNAENLAENNLTYSPLLSSNTARRATYNDINADTNLHLQMLNDWEGLSYIGIYPEICTPTAILSENLIVYNLHLTDTIVNQITTHRNAQNHVVVDFYEGDKHDELIYLDNGNLIVNGCLINNENNIVTYTQKSLVQPRMRNDEFSTSPWGSASEYTKYVGVYSGEKCSWGVTTIVGMSVGAVAAIICTAVKAGLQLSLFASIFSSVAAAMITYSSIYGMDDAYYSWRFEQRERTGSYALDKYYEYDGYCYSQHRQNGEKFKHTFYRHNYFS